MADELRQELLSKARGIGATPKKVLINEGIERWLPMVMGIAGPPGPKGPPFKVPPLPKGQQLFDELVEQARRLEHGRGRDFLTPKRGDSDIERLQELMPDYQPHPAPKNVSQDDYLKGLIVDKSEPAAKEYLELANSNPQYLQFVRDFMGGGEKAWNPKTGITNALEGPANTSDEALQRLMRFLAD